VLDHLADRPRAYLLWGGPAHKAGMRIGPDKNLKIETVHPSPLSAHRGFLGSKPFSRTNAWLHRQGHGSINWGDPEAL
jgi:uracil-DNA glycosylase